MEKSTIKEEDIIPALKEALEEMRKIKLTKDRKITFTFKRNIGQPSHKGYVTYFLYAQHNEKILCVEAFPGLGVIKIDINEIETSSRDFKYLIGELIA